MRERRRSRAALAAALLAAGLASRATADPGTRYFPVHCDKPGQITTDAGGWRHARAPRFSRGPQAIASLAINANRRAPGYQGTDGLPYLGRGDELVDATVTNGVAVAETRDSGCTWTDVPLPAGLVTALPDSVHVGGVRVGQLDTAGTTVRYTFVYGTVGDPVPRPFVYTGTASCPSKYPCAATTALTDTSATLATAGPPLDLAVSSGNPRCAWLLAAPALPGDGAVLFRSVDSGGTWTAVSRNAPVTRLADHPYGGNGGSPCTEVWGRTGDAVLRSVDRGASFGPVFGGHGDITAFGLRQFWRKAANGLCCVPATDLEADVVTKDGAWHSFGATAPTAVTTRRTPGVGTTVVVPSWTARGTIAVGTATGLYEWSAGRWRDVSPAGKPLETVQVDGEGLWDVGCAGTDCVFPFTLVGFTATELVYQATPIPPGKKYASTPIAPIDATVPRPMDASLAPARLRVDLRPGERRRVPFAFTVPWTPPAVDVDFDIDTTDSMDPVIDGVAGSATAMVRLLERENLDLEVGVASIKDFDGASGFPYKRVLRMGPAGAEFVAALRGLNPGSGGTDTPESQTFGIVQALTGSGHAPDAASPVPVAPGGDARWRPNADRVLVLVTNAGTKETAPDPTIAQTAAALRRAGAHVVVVLITPNDGALHALDQYRRLAAGSGSLAPFDGVDCDGDKQVDIDAGEPLVCLLPANGADFGRLGLLVGRLVLAARPRTAFRLGFTGDTAPLVATQGAGSVSVDSLRPHVVRLTADLACPATLPPRDHDLALEARLHGAVVARSLLTVGCTAPPAVRRPVANAAGVVAVTAAHPHAAIAVPNIAPAEPIPVNAPNVNAQPATGSTGVAVSVPEPDVQVMTETAGDERPNDAGPTLLFMVAASLMLGTALWRAHASAPCPQRTNGARR